MNFKKIEKDKSVEEIIKPLSDKEKIFLNNIKNNLKDNEEISRINGAIVRNSDFIRLKKEGWLNDECVNFYMGLLQKRNLESPHQKNMRFFSSFFYEELQRFGFVDNLKKWGGQKLDIFSLENLYAPIYLPNHWCMLEISFSSKKITYMDSFAQKNAKLELLIFIYLFCKKFGYEITWDKDNHEKAFDNWDKKEQFEQFKKEWEFKYKFNDPIQFNSCDCGVFACLFSLFSSSQKEINFDQSNIDDIRERFQLQIINYDL